MRWRVIESWLRPTRLGTLAGMRGLARLVVSAGVALGGLVATGCSGGQTGEITEPTRCERVSENVALEALRPEIREAFGETERAVASDLAWGPQDSSGDATTTLRLTMRREAMTVERLGEAPCAAAWRSPVELRVLTDDGRLDATLSGALTVNEDATANLRADAPLSALVLTDVDDDPTALLRLVADHGELGWRGAIFLQDGAAERVLATF